MFTGIIEGLGTISRIEKAGQGTRLTLNSDFLLEGTGIGDSIAVNGACLTAVSVEIQRFQVDVSPETVAISTIGRARIGDRVNLERALRLTDRLDGHLVSGHIDCIGTINQKKTLGNALVFTIRIPSSFSRYLIPKGSIAVDGISLTINHCEEENFDVAVIPHTAAATTMSLKKINDPVNIETDLIGKYIEKLMLKKEDSEKPVEKKKSILDMDLLAKTGFLS